MVTPNFSFSRETTTSSCISPRPRTKVSPVTGSRSTASVGSSSTRRASPEKILSSSPDRKSTRLNSSHVRISYAVFCLKKKKNTNDNDIKYKKHNKIIYVSAIVHLYNIHLH